MPSSAQSIAYSILSSSRFAPEEAVTVIDTANTILRPMAEGGMLTPRVREEGLTKANQLAATTQPQSQQGNVKVSQGMHGLDYCYITILSFLR